MTRGDGIVIAVVIALALASVPAVFATTPSGSGSVTVDAPAGSSTLSLVKDGTYVIEGRRGDVVIRVAAGEARCVQADCPDHICVRSGPARAGRPVVCAPNGVSVALAERAESGLDAVSR